MTKNKFMTATLNPEIVSDTLRECARKHVLPYFRNLQDDQKAIKNDERKSEVSIADHESEAFLIEKLTALLPGSVVVGEESVEEDPAILQLLQDDSNLVWVIDPVDGTSNFIKGSETFCLMVSLVENGETQMGWIYDPCKDEMAFVRKGQGAFIEGRKMDANASGAIPEKMTGFARSKYAGKDRDDLAVKTLRCAGHEYLRMAQGQVDFIVYNHLKPWDHLAGALMVQEAGGVVNKIDGSAYTPKDHVGTLIIARNPAIWKMTQDHVSNAVSQKRDIRP
ncbi:MAG: inositol monophosphatase [Rhodospirillales bacterium]|nr:inositol monophosphatase [Rhodospirillales bacterium]